MRTWWLQVSRASLLAVLALVAPVLADEVEQLSRELRDEIPEDVLELLIAKTPPRLRGEGRPELPHMKAADQLYEARADSVAIVMSNRSFGAAVVVSDKGHLITSEHLVRSARATPGGDFMVVAFKPRSRWRLEKREEFQIARVIVRDVQRDLALLQLVKAPPGALTVAPLAQTPPWIGQPVFAIGHSTEFLWSLTLGIISNMQENRVWKTGDSPRSAAIIQTQAPVSPGSSGGPLFDDRGNVVGVILGGAPETPILNLAIHVRHVRDLIRQHGGAQGPPIRSGPLVDHSQLLISRKAAQ
jgi:S1-C subfamily serine protease